MKKLYLIFTCIVSVFFSLAQAPSFQWAKSMGSYGDDFSNDIAVDVSGNVYTTGYFDGTVDFDPGIGLFNLTSAGQQDIFISKLDASGNFVWAKHLGDVVDDNGRSIALDASGNVYITGCFNGTVDFDPGIGSFILTSVGVTDIFILKLDPSGNFVWVKSMGGTNGECGYSIALDASGNIYTTGYFNGTADFDPGLSVFSITGQPYWGLFISKLDPSGNFVWAKSINTSNAYAIAVDGVGNVFTTGWYSNTVDFDPGPAVNNLTSAGNTDVFITKLDASGNFVWAKSMGGANNDYCYSILTDASGNAYTTGSFQGAADFDPGVGTFSLSPSGIFVLKLDPSGNFGWAKSIIGSNSAGLSIASDVFGNLYTTGCFSTPSDFDPGVGSFNLTPTGSYDVFILKLNASGNFVWAEKVGGTNTEYGTSIALASTGHIYTTGYFYGTSDFNPKSMGGYNLTSAGGSDIFVHKMSQYKITTIDQVVDEFGELVAYPNPTNRWFTLQLNSLSQVSITNTLGQVVFYETKNEGKHFIDLQGRESGIYFVKVKGINGNNTFKIVKE